MTANKIISGTKIASEMFRQILDEVKNLKVIPGLAFIRVGNDPASEIYVTRKAKTALQLGIKSFVYEFEEHTQPAEVIQKIALLNDRRDVHGILVQLPLPKNFNSSTLTNAILPHKDVDGFTIENVGKLTTGQPGLVPCTPQGCLALIKSVCPKLEGLNAVVVGRSAIVGHPTAELLLQENCTVTMVHSHSITPEKIARQADILVTAVGKPRFITKEWVKEGAIVIDVGITRLVDDSGKATVVGDVYFDDVIDKVKAITPVPGGVGPMTIAYLMKNTLKALAMQQ
jgi:methylenetetrahydrofolate dehydrogenase (NADP+)/methenyltetrahydrofolate cyclohydrolase